MKSLELNIDNQTLVEECRSGDRDAMSILYTRFAPRMLHVISRYVSDSDGARDILHDGFIAAFTRLETIRDPERLDLWLATIMKNLSLKYLQAQNVTSILEEIPETIEEPELDDILDFTTLESLIRQLPEGYQKVFRLAVLEGKSHKEISRILGIAPNSSSSQLFHAKLRLRELIKEYKLNAGLISLLLLLFSSGIFFLARHDDTALICDSLSEDSMRQVQTSKANHQSRPSCESSSEEPASPVRTKYAYASISSIQTGIAVENTPSEENVSDNSSRPESAPLPLSNSDSVGVPAPPSMPESQTRKSFDDVYDSHQDQLHVELPYKATADKCWSTGISIDPGMLSFNGTSELADMQPPVNDPGPSHGTDEDRHTQAKTAGGTQTIETYLKPKSRRHYLPISFALTTERHLSSRLGVESGIAYSYLHTDFEHQGSVSTCRWHYLEIPLKVNFYAYASSRIKLYFGVGGRLAIPVYSYAQIAPNPYCRSGRFRSIPVWSAGGSVGVAFSISKRVDLFLEPSLRYHFPQECSIPNIWTDDEPWSISIPIGFRFNW